jgi:hypothetical protein
MHHGTLEEARGVAAMHTSLFRYPATLERVLSHGWATTQEIDQICQAWLAWGEEPGAFMAGFWCEAIAWAE